jgi:hypothetical protein
LAALPSLVRRISSQVRSHNFFEPFMADHVGKWAPGSSCTSVLCRYRISNILMNDRVNTDGPVLTQTDLYLLGTELQLNPILMNANPKFHLVFNLLTGSQ